jgi:hypothetical protein
MLAYQPWLDRELADLIETEPDLVAIADALAEAGADEVDVRTWASDGQEVARALMPADVYGIFSGKADRPPGS